ncbi:MAG: hypothetical protein JO152_05110 [Mycobacteriaceae bacterium]|nr:hypothetical protein [Mycobacteriaceae bacterium]
MSVVILTVGAITFGTHGGNANQAQSVHIAEEPQTSTGFSSTETLPSSSAAADTIPSTEATPTSSAPRSHSGSTPATDAPDTTEPDTARAITSVTISPQHPVTGDEVTFTVHLANRRMNDAVALYRDPTVVSVFPTPDYQPPDPSCTDTSVQAPEEALVWHVTVHVVGHHHHVVEMWGCRSTEPTVSFPVEYDVGTGSGPNNGPAVPVVTDFVVNGPSDVVVDTSDSDGALASVVLDWGDGSTPTRATENSTISQVLCVAAGDYMKTDMSYSASHTYATPGPHTVTVTVTSTNCDGGEPQTGSSTFTM